MDTLAHLIRALVAALADRNRLAIQNAVLRQQILVLKRSVTRARVDDVDRMFWIFLRRWVRGWPIPRVHLQTPMTKPISRSDPT
jgi:hypothetical protein